MSDQPTDAQIETFAAALWLATMAPAGEESSK